MKLKIKTGKRSLCEYCNSSVAHNVGTESDIYCHTCKKIFAQEDIDVYLWNVLNGVDPRIGCLYPA